MEDVSLHSKLPNAAASLSHHNNKMWDLLERPPPSNYHYPKERMSFTKQRNLLLLPLPYTNIMRKIKEVPLHIKPLRATSSLNFYNR